MYGKNCFVTREDFGSFKSIVTSSPDDRTTCTVSAVRAEPERKAPWWSLSVVRVEMIEMINQIPFWNPFGEYDCFMIVFLVSVI